MLTICSKSLNISTVLSKCILDKCYGITIWRSTILLSFDQRVSLRVMEWRYERLILSV